MFLIALELRCNDSYLFNFLVTSVVRLFVVCSFHADILKISIAAPLKWDQNTIISILRCTVSIQS